MKLRVHLEDNADLTYTSSDGRKVEVAQDSLVFSADDREAIYLLNGLVNSRWSIRTTV